MGGKWEVGGRGKSRTGGPLLISISCNIIDVLKVEQHKIKAKIWMNKPKAM
jgi:hypothetical protein